MRRMPLWVLVCKQRFFGQFLKAVLTEYSIIFAVLYWYVWTRLVPRIKGYRLEEESSVLDDGTTVTTLVHVPK